MRYRKKPVVVEARQYVMHRLEDRAELIEWCGAGHTAINEEGEEYETEALRIHTAEGMMLAHPGDWIIRGIAGEFYTCKPDIFVATYEAVVDEPAPQRSEEEWRALTEFYEAWDEHFQQKCSIATLHRFNQALAAVEAAREART